MQRQDEERARANKRDPKRPHCVVVFENGDRERRSGCLKVSLDPRCVRIFTTVYCCHPNLSTTGKEHRPECDISDAARPSSQAKAHTVLCIFLASWPHRVRTRNDPVRRSFSKVVTGTGCGNAVGIGLQSERVSTDNPGEVYCPERSVDLAADNVASNPWFPTTRWHIVLFCCWGRTTSEFGPVVGEARQMLPACLQLPLTTPPNTESMSSVLKLLNRFNITRVPAASKMFCR